MYNELPGLAHTACKQRPKYGRVESPFQWVVRHLHIGRHGRYPRLLCRICSRSSTARQLCSIISRQVLVVHGHDCGYIPPEGVLPLLLPDVLAVVGTGGGFGGPFLLEVCACCRIWLGYFVDAVERPARPVLADPLWAIVRTCIDITCACAIGNAPASSVNGTSLSSSWRRRVNWLLLVLLHPISTIEVAVKSESRARSDQAKAAPPHTNAGKSFAASKPILSLHLRQLLQPSPHIFSSPIYETRDKARTRPLILQCSRLYNV